MSLPRVPRSPGILATGIMATMLFVLFTGLSSEGGGWGKTVHVILTTETVTTGPAGVGIIHVDWLIRDHGGSGNLHQVLVIIVLEPASEVMKGRVTCPGHVSTRVLMCHVSCVLV